MRKRRRKGWKKQRGRRSRGERKVMTRKRRSIRRGILSSPGYILESNC